MTIQLEVGDKPDPKKGDYIPEGKKAPERTVPIGDPLELVYADSFLAKNQLSVGYLISAAMNERAMKLKPLAAKARKAK